MPFDKNVRLLQNARLAAGKIREPGTMHYTAMNILLTSERAGDRGQIGASTQNCSIMEHK